MVNNLVSALGRPDPSLLESFLARYDERVAAHPDITKTLIEKGLKYYEDHILPGKQYRTATDTETELFAKLAEQLGAPGVDELDEKGLQSLVFDIAKESGAEPREFFSAIYQVLLGQERGPRFGSFAKLVGPKRVIELIDDHVLAER